MKERLGMRKEVTRKEDGRYLIYYHFEELEQTIPDHDQEGGESHV
jgi:hypothetical protein